MSKTKKGIVFERETAALGRDYGRRCVMSGAVKGVPELAGDALWKFPWFDKRIQLECKHGYDDDTKYKSFRIYREWFDKHLQDAKEYDFYPAFAMKFKFTQSNGLSKFILIPFSTMERLIKEMDDGWKELVELRQWKEDHEEKENG